MDEKRQESKPKTMSLHLFPKFLNILIHLHQVIELFLLKNQLQTLLAELFGGVECLWC